MKNEKTTEEALTIEVTAEPVVHQLAKVVLCGLVGWATSKMAANGYDALVAMSRSKSIEA